MADKADEEKAESKAGKGKLIIMLMPTVLLLAAGAWFLFFRGGDSGVPKPLPAPAPGPVLALDSFTINLAGGHFLKLGMTLQPTKTAGSELSGAKALDLAITEFSGKSITELSTSDGRQAAKDELISRIKLAYLPETTAGEDALTAAIAVARGKPAATGKALPTPTTTAAPDPGAEIRELTAQQALAAAGALTVQPNVYDVYFTEFVMQ